MTSGMVVFVVLGALTGLSRESDAFFIAYTLPSFFQAAIHSSNYALTSTFTRILSTTEIQFAHKFYSSTLSIFTLVFMLISFVLYFSSPWLSLIIAPGVEVETYYLAIDLVRVQVWILPFLVVARITGAILNSHEYFAIVASGELVRYSTTIVWGILFAGDGARAISMGLVVGAFLQCIVIGSASLVQAKFRFRPCFRLLPGMIDLCSLIWVAIQSQFIRQGTSISDRFFASFLPTGSIALIQYGGRLVGPINQVFLSSVTTAMLPKLAQSIAQGMHIEVKRQLIVTVRLITLLALPTAVLLLSLNYPLVSIIFAWGDFDMDSVRRVAYLSLVYNLSLLLHGHLTFSTAYFYASSEKAKIIKVFATVTLVDVLIKIATIFLFGPIGAAISFTISVFVGAGLGMYYIVDKEQINIRAFFDLERSWLISTLSIGLIVYGINRITLNYWLYDNYYNIAILLGSGLISLILFTVYYCIWFNKSSLVKNIY